MANISQTLYTNSFLGSFLMSPIQMGSLSVNNSVTDISCLGTFKESKITFQMVSLLSTYQAGSGHVRLWMGWGQITFHISSGLLACHVKRVSKFLMSSGLLPFHCQAGYGHSVVKRVMDFPLSNRLWTFRCQAGYWLSRCQEGYWLPLSSGYRISFVKRLAGFGLF
jgi:hypothetical protein